jgi:sulfatase modifying factor 1
VTRGQFRRFIEDTNYKTDAELSEGGYGWNEAKKAFEGRDRKYSWKNTGVSTQNDDYPVTNVTRNDARKFCEWLAKKAGGRRKPREVRLPGEAEWEFACRAGSKGRFGYGDDEEKLAEYANVADATAKEMFPKWNTIQATDGHVFAAAVGSFRPNDFGLYDMHGNVWEWVEDYYGKYAALPKTRNALETKKQGEERPILRGGAYYNGPQDCRCARRYLVGIGGRYGAAGFRVVCVP